MKRIKSCIMVILSLAFVVTGICLFGNPTKEVQAETQYNTDMLSLKFQRGQGSISNKIRVVASVDSPNYSAVGFDIAKGDADATRFTINTKEYPLPRRIKSTVYNIEETEMRMEYAFSPKVVDTSSEYFLTGKWNAEEDVKYTVRAWAKAFDGTMIYGQSRCITLDDLDSTVDHLNMSFELKEDCTLSKDGDTYKDIKVSYNGKDTTAEVISVKGSTVHVNVNVDRTTLPSATKFVFENSDGTEEYGSTIFRNLYTSYSETTEGETTTNTADTSWYDVYKDEDAFVIATSADLYGLPKINDTFEGKKIYLCADIKANEGEAAATGWNGTGDGKTSYLWTPVGSKASKFNGIFDGQGHTISGIYVHTSSRAGLFNHTGGNSSIGRFDLLNSYIESWIEDSEVDGKKGSYSGSIAGYVEGKIHDIYSNAFVKGHTGDGTGGIVGAMGADEGTTEITNCHFAGNVSSEGQQVAGIVGVQTKNAGSSITDCTVSGSVTSTNTWGGGLVASVSAGEVTITRSAVTSEGQVQVSQTTGGLVGYVKGGKVTIDGSQFAGTVNAGWAVGGLVGRVSDSTVEIKNNSSFTGKLTGTDIYTGGVVGYVESGNVTIDNSSFAGNLTGKAHTGGVVGYVKTGVVKIQASDSNGTIDALSGDYAGGFVGDIAGGELTINQNSSFGGSLTSAGGLHGGFVGGASGGTTLIENCSSTTGATVTASSYNQTGGLVGYVSTGTVTINNSSFAGTLNAKYYAGGLVGRVVSGTVNINNSSSFTGTLNATSYAGGLVGYVNGGTFAIESSSFTGTLNATSHYVGGILGTKEGTNTINIKKCYSTGNVKSTGGNNVGGILGYISGGTVNMENCLNTGSVKAGDAGAGGLVGRTSDCTVNMENCLNRGEVTGQQRVGSVIGWSGGTVAPTNVYATKTSTATGTTTNSHQNVAVGDNTNLTWATMLELTDITVSEENNVTADNVKATLTGFNFDTIWTIGDNEGSMPELNLTK